MGALHFTSTSAPPVEADTLRTRTRAVLSLLSPVLLLFQCVSSNLSTGAQYVHDVVVACSEEQAVLNGKGESQVRGEVQLHRLL